MKKYIFSSITVFSLFTINAQNSVNEYSKLIHQADSLYTTKEYKKAAFAYSAAFKSNGWKGFTNDRYNAACSWALANYPDSAFFNLQRIANLMGYSNYDHTIQDQDLVSLYTDSRWKPTIEKIKENKEKAEAKLNKPLVVKLDSIYYDDQNLRKQIDEIEQKYGRDSKEIKILWKTIQLKDSINLNKITSILDKYGWLGSEEIGARGNSTLFLVIQHSDLNTQIKYLPMMREAIKNKNADPSSLALLEDRVLLGQGKKQLYGSQIGRNTKGEYYVLPLSDPDSVDKLRASMGLPPIAEYIKYWNMTWDIEKYKKQLPELEKELEKKKL